MAIFSCTISYFTAQFLQKRRTFGPTAKMHQTGLITVRDLALTTKNDGKYFTNITAIECNRLFSSFEVMSLSLSINLLRKLFLQYHIILLSSIPLGDEYFNPEHQRFKLNPYTKLVFVKRNKNVPEIIECSDLGGVRFDYDS